MCVEPSGRASDGTGLEHGCVDEMRPVVMACMAAGLGLLPAAVSNGIGAQAQQPLARVVVGGMATTIIAILFVMPLLLRRPPGPSSMYPGDTEAE